jgi:hypothetical protein
MKTIDLATAAPTLAEVLALANQEDLVLRTAEGKEFVLAELHDMDRELALIGQQKDFMDLLRQRWQEQPRHRLQDVRAMLNKDA